MQDVTEVGAEFVRALAAGDANAAHQLLTSPLASDVAASDLLAEFEALADELGGVTGIGEPMVILTEWPDMSEGDRAMVYVPLEGDMFSEAVTLKVSEIDNMLRVSSVEWGRP